MVTRQREESRREVCEGVLRGFEDGNNFTTMTFCPEADFKPGELALRFERHLSSNNSYHHFLANRSREDIL